MSATARACGEETFAFGSDELVVTAREHGGEPAFIKDCVSGLEFLWQDDPAYWGVTVPIPFPICGSLRNVGDAVGEDRRM
ncbi:hypothetical protein [Olsenella sp. HMSC062G07]|uniref:hypothetical protein n=1 Tax=Olsenella sp. HMSC062G07 TaxID=1739330 RepID=UPI0008A49504|nr:hypothetical protein [Olsenella sp. HMSC062G07]OFK23413.1 hypothetical protein HMPREF2826_04845 [Olsenella sp. HMSC062G07]